MPSVVFPLVNEYKYSFIKRRLVETFLGGVKFRISNCLTVCINCAQLTIFIFPFVVSAVLIVLTELGALTVVEGMYVIGAIIFIFTIGTQLCSLQIQTRTTTVAQVKSKLVDLTEDDTLDGSSCCGPDTLQYIIPIKKYKLNIVLHGAIAGLMCAVMFHYFAPQTLEKNCQYECEWLIYLLVVTGWVAVSIAQFSLTTCAPPEPVVYHALDWFEIASLMRPFYVLLFSLFHLLAWYYPWWLAVDCSLHIVFPFLPFLWFMGILPPLDALFGWFGEQLLIYGCGGSAMASDVRLLLMLCLSTLSVVILYFIPSFAYCVIAAAVFGYGLSLNLCNLWSLVECAFHSAGNVEKYSAHSTPSPSRRMHKTPSKCSLLTVCFYLIVFVIATAVVTVLQLTGSVNEWRHFYDTFGYIFIVLVIAETVLASLQQVYIIKGFFANPLFPLDTTQLTYFLKKTKPLNFLGYVRIVIVHIAGPILMATYLSLFILESSYTVVENHVGRKCFFIITIARAFRWIWQHPENSLFEMTLVHFVNVLYPTGVIAEFGLLTELLLAAIIHNRFRQVLQKVHLAVVLLISSVTIKKQRHSRSGCIVALNLLFLPAVLAIIGASSIVSAPLLPLFTLPIFLIGFPRPLRTWPGQVRKTSTTTGDSVYYRQLAPLLAKGFQRCQMLGSIGSINVGDHFLVRFEDRLTLVLVLEKGYGFCTVGIKGLELQETSCHAVEATHLDSLLSAAFERDRGNGGRGMACMNPDPFHVFQPLTTIYLVTYSDTRNVLTGVIDSPDTLKLIASSFVKTLIWVLLHHCAKKHLESKKSAKHSGKEEGFSDDVKHLSIPGSRPPTAESLRKLPKAKRVEECLDELTHTPSKIQPRILRNDATSPHRPVSRNSVANSWSDDDDDPLGEIGTSSTKRPISIFTKPREEVIRPGTTVLYATHLPGTVGNNTDHDLEFGLPAIDVGHIGGKGDGKLITGRPTFTVIGSPICYSKFAAQLSPPFPWLELPFDPKEMTPFRDLFPIKWYYFVLKLVASKFLHLDDESQNELENDDTLMKVYRDLILTCHVIVNVLIFKSDGQVHLRPSHVYKTFQGETAWSPSQDWLTQHDELYSLVIKAYGYATKLALDQTLLGESDTDKELADYLLEYDDSWYIGSDISPGWGENVLNGTPNLFSLGYNPVQRTFTSHLLTLQELPAHIGSLNPEVVRGLWASLAFELFYLTNDDEERYSIQAHPIILRNLIIQAADPPLGYPLFASEAIAVGLDCVSSIRTKS